MSEEQYTYYKYSHYCEYTKRVSAATTLDNTMTYIYNI